MRDKREKKRKKERNGQSKENFHYNEMNRVRAL